MKRRRSQREANKRNEEKVWYKKKNVKLNNIEENEEIIKKLKYNKTRATIETERNVSSKYNKY